MHNISHAKKGLNMSDATISKLFHPGTNATRIFKNIKKLLFFNSNSGTNAIHMQVRKYEKKNTI